MIYFVLQDCNSTDVIYTKTNLSPYLGLTFKIIGSDRCYTVSQQNITILPKPETSVVVNNREIFDGCTECFGINTPNLTPKNLPEILTNPGEYELNQNKTFFIKTGQHIENTKIVGPTALGGIVYLHPSELDFFNINKLVYIVDENSNYSNIITNLRITHIFSVQINSSLLEVDSFNIHKVTPYGKYLTTLSSTELFTIMDNFYETNTTNILKEGLGDKLITLPKFNSNGVDMSILKKSCSEFTVFNSSFMINGLQNILSTSPNNIKIYNQNIHNYYQNKNFIDNTYLIGMTIR